MEAELIHHLRGLIRAADGPGLQALLAQEPGLLFAEEPELVTLVALALLFLDRTQEATPLVAAVQSSPEPQDGQALADRALLFFLIGQGAEALRLIRAATDRTADDAVLWARRGAFATALGELEEAEGAYARALALEPQPRPELLNNMAALKLRQGRLSEAVELYDRALAVKPDLEVAARQRLLALAHLGRGEEALETLERELAENLDDPARHRRLAEAQALLGDRRQAAATLLAAVERLPHEHGLRQDAARLLLAGKEFGRAGTLLKEWLEKTPDLSNDTRQALRLLLNEARLEAGFFEAAEKDLADLAEDDPDGTARLLMARLYTETERAGDAVPLLEDLVASLPGRLDALLQLSHTLTSLGRLDEARRYLAQVEAAAPGLIAQRIEAADGVATPEERAALERMFANPILPPEQRASMGFTLHGVLAKAGEAEAAFSVLREANELIKKHLSYDWRDHRRLVEELLAVFTPDLVARLQGQGHTSRRPIFVVGMPRSGTTLTEQILGAHPECSPRGELPWVARITRLMPKALGCDEAYPAAMTKMSARDLVNAGAYYLEKAGAGVDERLRLVDKMPHNFDAVGLIALMFPNAPIVHVVRDPMDTALSNYQQNFAAAHGLMGFAFDLEWIGEMLVDHDRIMAHWEALFPGRIFRLEYEHLVHDPETTIRALLEFCGLPWDEAVLRYSENPVAVRTASIRQVRRGIYTESTAKWRRYEAELQPVAAILARGFQTLAELGETAPGVPLPRGLWGVTR